MAFNPYYGYTPQYGKTPYYMQQPMATQLMQMVKNGNTNQNNNNSLFLLEILSNVLQIASYIMLQKDSSNNDIMQELQLQDKLLSEQTNIYLKNIIRQNEEILKKLDKNTSL